MTWKRWLAGCFALFCTVALTAPLWAQTSGSAQWQAEYWNNTTLAGAPAYTRIEAEIDQNWGLGSPNTTLISSDRFSARWSTTVNLPAGRYRFTVTADDGVRLWVDNRLLINEWTVQSADTFQEELTWNGGTVPVRVEYFENTGEAAIQLRWSRIDVVAAGADAWLGEYFNNPSLQGAPAVVRSDEAIDFNWGTGAPAPGQLDADTFSVRWTNQLTLPAGRYQFTINVDDGARLWVNNNLLIDAWRVQALTTYQAEVDLGGGSVPLRLEYFEDRGGALIELRWTRLDAAPVRPAPDAVGAPVNVWRGEYYDNVTLDGAPAFVRNDEQLNFDWGAGSPAPSQLGNDRFSIRWTRTLSLAPGRYEFTATADDGVRLWVDGQLVLNQWTVQSAQPASALVDVTGGATPVRMEYFENTGIALARLTWVRADGGASTPTGARTARITGANFLNVRSGPGVGFGRIAVLTRGDVVDLIGRRPGSLWVQIRLNDGRTGWVNSRYLTSNVPLTELPAAQ
ncbi:MAG: PA14 domain-containing protein [Caldilineaceae bacterium]